MQNYLAGVIVPHFMLTIVRMMSCIHQSDALSMCAYAVFRPFFRHFCLLSFSFSLLKSRSRSIWHTGMCVRPQNNFSSHPLKIGG